jgi:hypothetical protein
LGFYEPPRERRIIGKCLPAPSRLIEEEKGRGATTMTPADSASMKCCNWKTTMRKKIETWIQVIQTATEEVVRHLKRQSDISQQKNDGLDLSLKHTLERKKKAFGLFSNECLGQGDIHEIKAQRCLFTVAWKKLDIAMGVRGSGTIPPNQNNWFPGMDHHMDELVCIELLPKMNITLD